MQNRQEMGSICCKSQHPLDEFNIDLPYCDLCLSNRELTHWVKITEGFRGLNDRSLVCTPCVEHMIKEMKKQEKDPNFHSTFQPPIINITRITK